MLTRDEMEQRRLAAAKLFEVGINPSRVGETFEVSRTTAYRWEQLFLKCGIRGLKKHKASGRRPKLTERQREVLGEWCQNGPYAAGYAQTRWTTALLAEAILKKFHVRYEHNHVGRLLHQMGVEWRPGRSCGAARGSG